MQIVRPEMTTLFPVIDLVGDRECRDADRVFRGTDIENPGMLAPVLLIIKYRLIGNDQQFAAGQGSGEWVPPP